MAVALLTAGATLLSFRYADLMPGWARAVTGVLSGATICLYLYLAIFLMPYYLLGLFAMLGLAIGFHVFVPLLLVYHTISATIHLKLAKPAIIGAALSLIFVAAFCAKYSLTVRDINKIYNRNVVEAGKAFRFGWKPPAPCNPGSSRNAY